MPFLVVKAANYETSARRYILGVTVCDKLILMAVNEESLYNILNRKTFSLQLKGQVYTACERSCLMIYGNENVAKVW